jgi:hypothetical protein
LTDESKEGLTSLQVGLDSVVYILAALLEAGVFLLGPYFLAGLPPELLFHVVDVVASVGVVLVGYFGEVFDFSAGHFEDGVEDGVVDGVGEPLTLFVLEVLLANKEEEVDPGAPEVAVVVPFETVAAVLPHFGTVGTGNADVHSHIAFRLNVVRVDGQGLATMVLRIDKLEDELPNELIVSVDDQ